MFPSMCCASRLFAVMPDFECRNNMTERSTPRSSANFGSRVLFSPVAVALDLPCPLRLVFIPHQRSDISARRVGFRDQESFCVGYNCSSHHGRSSLASRWAPLERVWSRVVERRSGYHHRLVPVLSCRIGPTRILIPVVHLRWCTGTT